MPSRQRAVAMVPEKVGVKQVHLDEMIQVCMIVSTAAAASRRRGRWTVREVAKLCCHGGAGR